MMKRYFFLFLSLMMMPVCLWAQSVNLTPWPKQMTKKSGTFVFPHSFVVDASAADADQQAEAERFVADFNAATGYSATLGTADPLIAVSKPSATMSEEGYRLTVTETHIDIQASTAVGVYYAFQSIKKMLPGHVVLGIPGTAASYSLPLVTVVDAPRYRYRGFMLDVSRHFFEVEEIKKILRVMSYYKMNTFHWHLTDDQGWRVEIKKYPKLTTVGATRDNSRNTSLKYGYYYTNKPYGPYYYTQDQIREVVAYAEKLHITIVPEIDMPGHFCAAMTAYPEFSCWPNGSHNVWIEGGVSNDVLNVANPDAVQFAKDVLTEMAEMFPGEQIHIGGDECPTTAWEGNALCQAKYKELGLSNYRQLQSIFIKEMADHLATLGKKISVWNEAITVGNADTDMVKSTGATVYCWVPSTSAAQKANQLGLPCVITPYEAGQCFYINRRANTLDYGAGNGTADHLRNTYNYAPPQVETAIGVQGTFWCEHVSDTDHLEHLALPRLMAVAESGWTPAGRKDFDSFVSRMKQDTAMLRLGGYHYHPQFIEYDGIEPVDENMVLPVASTASTHYWYKIVTNATGERKGRCMELLRSGSPLLSTYSSYGAQAGRLWTNVQAEASDAAYDYQQWAFEQDPAHPGRYALVCKAIPDGSLKAAPTAATVNGYWTYDASAKHYNFQLGVGAYGTSGDCYYYTLNSDQASGQYMNHSMSGKGYRVNCYSDPNDGNGGQWVLQPQFEGASAVSLKEQRTYAQTLLASARTYASEADRQVGRFSAEAAEALRAAAASETITAEQLTAAIEQMEASLVWPEKGDELVFRCTAADYVDRALCDKTTAAYLTHTADVWGATGWRVTASGIVRGLTKRVRLTNVATERLMGVPSSTEQGKMGFGVEQGSATAVIVLTYNPEEGDFSLSNDDKIYFPIADTNTSRPSTVSSAAGAIHPQGTGWNLIPVRILHYTCIDAEGKLLGTYYYSCPIAEVENPAMPSFDGLYLQHIAVDGTEYTLRYGADDTAIRSASAGAEPVSAAIFDLSGRRVSPNNLRTGIYLSQGRKILR